MPAMRIIPAFDEIEDCKLSFTMRLETQPVEQLAFKGCKEALAHCVVVAIVKRRAQIALRVSLDCEAQLQLHKGLGYL